MRLFIQSLFLKLGVEGILLYRALVVVFNTIDEHRTPYYLLAYGCPLLIVSGTVIAASILGDDCAYVDRGACWLNNDTVYKWTFIAPVIFILCANMIVLVISLRIAWKVGYADF